jgi:AP endonuclease 2
LRYTVYVASLPHQAASAIKMIGQVRLLTWNVNGLRACVQRLKKKNLKELLDALGADILCFQETKMTRSELDEELARPEGA